MLRFPPNLGILLYNICPYNAIKANLSENKTHPILFQKDHYRLVKILHKIGLALIGL